MKTIVLKVLLQVAVWAFDKVYAYADKDNDNQLSKEELKILVKDIDTKSKALFKKIK